MKKLVCLVPLLFSVGCATVSFRPYVGEQQAWPTAQGSIVNIRYDLPIFTSLPPVPYTVLGEMRIESPIYAVPEERHLAGIIKKAQELGADALAFVDGAIYFSSNYGPAVAPQAGGSSPTLSQVNRFSPQAFMPNISILAIKWTDGPPPGLPEKYAPVKVEEMAEPAPAAAAPPPAPEPAKRTEPTTNFGPRSSGK